MLPADQGLLVRLDVKLLGPPSRFRRSRYGNPNNDAIIKPILKFRNPSLKILWGFDPGPLDGELQAAETDLLAHGLTSGNANWCSRSIFRRASASPFTYFFMKSLSDLRPSI